MALKKLCSKYGVVELNHVASVKTGMIKAQYALDATNFASIPAENGMLLVVDEVNEKVKLPSSADDYVYLHASVEKIYDGISGRNTFAVNQKDDFLPRMYKLDTGDIFETNAVQYDDATFANFTAIKSSINTTTVYGVPSTTGYIKLVSTPAGTERVILKAVKGVTLPNGENGIKFVVERARNFDDATGQ